MYDIGDTPSAYIDALALRQEVIGPVAHRDSPDRVVLAGYPELGPEWFQVLRHDAEEAGTEPFIDGGEQHQQRRRGRG